MEDRKKREETIDEVLDRIYGSARIKFLEKWGRIIDRMLKEYECKYERFGYNPKNTRSVEMALSEFCTGLTEDECIEKLREAVRKACGARVTEERAKELYERYEAKIKEIDPLVVEFWEKMAGKPYITDPVTALRDFILLMGYDPDTADIWTDMLTGMAKPPSPTPSPTPTPSPSPSPTPTGVGVTMTVREFWYSYPRLRGYILVNAHPTGVPVGSVSGVVQVGRKGNVHSILFVPSVTFKITVVAVHERYADIMPHGRCIWERLARIGTTWEDVYYEYRPGE